MAGFDFGFYSAEELREMGFKHVGDNSCIDKSCTVLGAENIVIGNNVRVDSYTTLNALGGSIVLGDYIHIGAYCMLSGGGGITMADFSGLSQGCKIYSKTDDYSGKFMTNPMVPAEFTGAVAGEVSLERHVIIGSNTVILPGVTVGVGSSVGAQSLVLSSLDEWGVYFGAPAKKIKRRSKKLLELEKQFLENRDK